MPGKSSMKTPQEHGFFDRLWPLAAIGIALVVLGCVFRLHYKLVIVSGTSMVPTLEVGDVLLVDKRAYEKIEPDRGDIVVAKWSANLVVKRVVGLPGEEVGVKRGRLYINGGLVKDQHPIEPGYLDVEEGVLLPGDFATLGDNRSVAPASAVHPIVTKSDIVGKVVLILGKQIM